MCPPPSCLRLVPAFIPATWTCLLLRYCCCLCCLCCNEAWFSQKQVGTCGVRRHGNSRCQVAAVQRQQCPQTPGHGGGFGHPLWAIPVTCLEPGSSVRSAQLVCRHAARNRSGTGLQPACASITPSAPHLLAIACPTQQLSAEQQHRLAAPAPPRKLCASRGHPSIGTCHDAAAATPQPRGSVAPAAAAAGGAPPADGGAAGRGVANWASRIAPTPTAAAETAPRPLPAATCHRLGVSLQGGAAGAIQDCQGADGRIRLL